jgi:hypothetical protein
MLIEPQSIMSQDQFLAFKGLKQYTPEMGWESLSAESLATGLNGHPNEASTLGIQTGGPASHLDFQSPSRTPPKSSHSQTPRSFVALNDLTGLPQQANNSYSQEDPLIAELFDQLRQPVEDQLSKSWKTIASNVNLLSQRMEQQRQLRAQLKALEEEAQALRGQILTHLDEVQQTADRQLYVARLRMEVSSLARQKLADKLKKSES